MTLRLIAPILLLLAAALPGLAQPHPFGGEVIDLVAEAHAVTSAPTLAERKLAGEKLLKTLYKDPHLAKLGPKMKLEAWVEGLAKGEPFDARAFQAAAKAAIATNPPTSVDVGPRELMQKLRVIEVVFRAPSRGANPSRGPPLDLEAIKRHSMSDVIGAKKTMVLKMESVPGARVTMVSSTVNLPSGTSREAVALDLYGRMLVNSGTGNGTLRAGLAHNEVGRAVLGPAAKHPAGAGTSDVLKGIGPTPYANNRFNSKATGTFPLPEAVRDWEKTETLRKAGVAVYEPVAIVELPFMEWSQSEGWRPVAVYVRRGRENLRVSDLDKLSEPNKRKLVARLKGKIEAELKGVGRSAPIADADVIRSFVERVGRTAGIFDGGIGGGRYWFHGMLHDQNVSMLGEIMDVGNSDGVMKSREAMRKAWEKSNYTWWPKKLAEYKDLKGTGEKAVFERLAKRFNAGLKTATGGGISEAELNQIFREAYQQGRRGVSAADPKLALTVRAPNAVATNKKLRALDKYRRADGTLDWRRMTKDKALREGAGLAQFTLALFLKEIAIVAATGDRARIEEFFDGLMTTDFYKHYGLFVAGARVSEVAYTRYLQRYVKPRFVNGVLKTNLVLAAGMALPLIAEGKFEGKAFAISVTSLGLSSLAVQSGAAGIKWVMNLNKAKNSGVLARFGKNAPRLAKLGGWFYTVAELAVVLYVAEKVDVAVNDYLDRKQAREALAKAGRELLKVANGAPSQAKLERAAEAYHEAWIGYRNFLYRPLEMEEAVFASRLEKYAKKAKLLADKRAAALAQLKGHPSLEANIKRRYGSLKGYAEHLIRQDEKALKRDLDLYTSSYSTNRAKLLRAVYEDGQRSGSFLGGLGHSDWLLAGGRDHAQGDPYGRRTDLFASWGRSRVRGDLDDALGNASGNRLQAYDDEAEMLAALAKSLRDRGDKALADVVSQQRAKVLRLKGLDQQLIKGNGVVDTRSRAGASNALERLSTPAR